MVAFVRGNVTLRGAFRVSDITGLETGTQALEQKNRPFERSAHSLQTHFPHVEHRPLAGIHG